MTITTAVERLPESGRWESWTPQQEALMEFAGLGKVIRPSSGMAPFFQGAPRGVVEGFLLYVQRSGLDPYAKQIYCAEVGGRYIIMAAIDGLRLTAQRSARYNGQTDAEWLYPDGTWRSYWRPAMHGGAADEKPQAARVGVFLKGVDHPTSVTVAWSEFGIEGRGAKDNWTMRPAHMLAIRAESHALRKAFPIELSGMYTAEDFQTGHAEPDPDEIVVEDFATQIAALDDLADAEQLYRDILNAEAMTIDLRALFQSKVATIEKDSRPPKPGRPGETGDADIDAPATEPDGAAPDAANTPAEAHEDHPVDSEPADGRTAAQAVPDPETDPEGYQRYLDELDAAEAAAEQ